MPVAKTNTGFTGYFYLTGIDKIYRINKIQRYKIQVYKIQECKT